MTTIGAPRGPRLQPVPLDVRTVLVATDGSAADEASYRVALWLASRLGAVVELVTVTSGDDPAERAALIAGTAAGHPATELRVVVGDDPVDELSAAISCGEGVIGCMATRARSRTAPLLGSTATAVLERTWAPLVLVGPRAGGARHAGPIVVAVAGDRADDDLVAVAEAWAEALRRPLVAVRVVEPGVDDEHPRGEVAFEPITVQDGLVPLLERLGPSLVVVGHRTHHPLHRVVVGDHTATIVRVAPAPVLAVPVGLHR
jgi:nucleotide-binding universal stress UspA family protein